MKVTIEIPSEFVSHYKDDKFKDSFKRCIFDLKDHTAAKIERYLAWNCDVEVLEMLMEAFDKVDPFEEEDK